MTASNPEGSSQGTGAMGCVEEHAKHGKCLSKVAGDESGASMGGGLH